MKMVIDLQKTQELFLQYDFRLIQRTVIYYFLMPIHFFQIFFLCIEFDLQLFEPTLPQYFLQLLHFFQQQFCEFIKQRLFCIFFVISESVQESLFFVQQHLIYFFDISLSQWKKIIKAMDLQQIKINLIYKMYSLFPLSATIFLKIFSFSFPRFFVFYTSLMFSFIQIQFKLRTMQSIFLTSFSLFLTLFLKTKDQNKYLSIVKTVDLIIYPNQSSDILIDKRRKNKKKKNNKSSTNSSELFLKNKTNQLEEVQFIKVDQRCFESQQSKLKRLRHVHKELQALSSYFMDDLETIIPYNGQFGHYLLIIPIPGNIYSQLPIQFKLGSDYPYKMVEMKINTKNLHPLEKEKLSEIVKVEQQNFLKSHTYEYIFNTCCSIYEKVICYSQFQEEEQIQQKNVEKNKIIIDQNAKQIYQAILQQILEQYEDDNSMNVSMVKHQQEYHKKNNSSRGRYMSQFQQLQKIGEGGFGRVYKVRNKVDSNIYAVKKLVINYGDKQSRKMLKQVAFLSKLNHPNIVRYYQSWLQDTTSVEELISDMSITDVSQIQEFNKIWLQYAKDLNSSKMLSQNFDYEEDNSIMFGDDIAFQDNSDIVFGNASLIEQSHNLSNEIQNDQIKLNHKSSQIIQFPFKILYVVMEFCSGTTLKDFIQKRFSESNETKVKVIRGILQGLSCLHSRRIIHRDLKPANIFLVQNNKVKIGDFGLATVGNIQNNPYQVQIIEYTEKTKGVGTYFYRAPQQLKSNYYDEKVDIYSLGIIMLELFYQFGTIMQRSQVLTQTTKNQNLPKDFNKIEQNSDYQQLLKSCISEKPSNRPNVQKLLQTFRNKYFTQLVSYIANPKHFQFYQLLNHLFNINNQSSVIMKQNLFKNYITNALLHIYQTHRGILFAPLSLIPLSLYQTLNGIHVPSNRKNKFLLLSQKGVVLQYPSNSYSSWIRYAKQTMRRTKKGDEKQEMRRYTFEKVCEFIGGDVKSQFSFKQKYITAFDITYALQNGYNKFYICQGLKISEQITKTMSLTQESPSIYLCHSLVFKFISKSWKINQNNLYRFLLSLNDEKFRSLKYATKLQEMKKFCLEKNIAKKLITFFNMEFTSFEELINEINEQYQYSQFIQIFQEIQSIASICSKFGLRERFIWKLQIPYPNTFGIFWSIGPVRGFTSEEEYLSGSLLSNIHIETSLNIGSDETDTDVSIWSNGEYLQEDIMEIVAKCWEEGVTAKWYDQSHGEKDLSCRSNIILKKKKDRIYFMIRKNFDRNLQKKYSEEKQDKESSFFPKQNFNFDVIRSLSKDFQKKYITH